MLPLDSVKSASNTTVHRVRATTQNGIPILPGVVTTVLVGLIYLLVASGGTLHFVQSLYPHHVLIADAWLHGQLYARDETLHAQNATFLESVRTVVESRLASRGVQFTAADWQQMRATLPEPPAMHDWSFFDGKLYSYFGPMPALLLLPYVALAGPTASDMLVSCLLGMATVFLMFLVLREAHRRRVLEATTPLCVGLSLLLGLGTVQFYLVVLGQVWFLSQIAACAFLTLAIYLILQTTGGIGWPLAAGAAFGAGMLARASLLPTVGFFYLVLLALSPPGLHASKRRLFGQAAAFSLPLIAAAAIAAAYNYARFGAVRETGGLFQRVTPLTQPILDRYLRHGILSLSYLPGNLYHYFLNPTLLRRSPTNAISFDPQGNSMLLVTPALLYVFRAYRPGDWFVRAVWLGAAGLMVPLLLLGNGGAIQFGARYMLDLMPLAIILMASGMRGKLTRIGVTLIVLSIAINAWGTYRFGVENGTAASVAAYADVAQLNYAASYSASGSAAMGEGKPEEAVRQYTRALEVVPDSADLHNRLGNALSAQRKFTEAIAQYAEALRLAPASAEAHNNLGTALAAQGKTAEGIAQFQEALDLNPDYAEAHYNLATLLLGQRRFDEAKTHFTTVLRLRPQDAAAHNNLGVLLFEQGQDADALREYQQALEIKPDYPDAHRNLAAALVATGKAAEAIVHYEAALHLQPDDATTHRNLGTALEQHGDRVRAAEELQAARDLDSAGTAARQGPQQLP